MSVCVCLSGLGVALHNGHPFRKVDCTHCLVCVCVCKTWVLPCSLMILQCSRLHAQMSYCLVCLLCVSGLHLVMQEDQDQDQDHQGLPHSLEPLIERFNFVTLLVSTR